MAAVTVFNPFTSTFVPWHPRQLSCRVFSEGFSVVILPFTTFLTPVIVSTRAWQTGFPIRFLMAFASPHGLGGEVVRHFVDRDPPLDHGFFQGIGRRRL